MSSIKKKKKSAFLLALIIFFSITYLNGFYLPVSIKTDPALYAEPIISEGVSTIRADMVHAEGHFGEGVKVAVLDFSFDPSNPEIANNVVEAKSFREDGVIWDPEDIHGTICAEIVVDVAPKAELYLLSHNTFDGIFNAIDYAMNIPVQIISSSIALPTGPFDGNSGMDQKVGEARANGILFCTVAGNSGSSHWEGVFADTDGDEWHEYDLSTKDETIDFDAIEGEDIIVFLNWWDDSPAYARALNQDYDLYISRRRETLCRSR
jgi:subtilisin family serine protease